MHRVVKEILAIIVLVIVLASDPAASTASVKAFNVAAEQRLGAGVMVEVAPECEAAFKSADTVGTFVLYAPDQRQIWVCDPQRATQGFLPASTFKIFNALTALETGAVRDEHETIAWDKIKRRVPDWNRDHDLASAMQVSAVWYYQIMARRIGEARMRDWIERVGYGNADIAGGIDQFWLDGKLRISALEQVAFLERLRNGTLPYSARSQEIVRKITLRERGKGYELHAKTGWTVADQPGLGWYVGWLERDGKPYYFALNMDIREDAQAPQRERLARVLMAARGLLPAP
jgi:beta-lactamase class D